MASIAQAAQQISRVSQLFNSDIPLAAWGEVIAALSLSTLEDLLKAYAESKSLVHERDNLQKLYMTYAAAATSLLSREGPVSAGDAEACCQELLTPVLGAELNLTVTQQRQVVEAFSTMIAAGGQWPCAIKVFDQALATARSADNSVCHSPLDDCGGSLGRQRLQASCVMLESLLTKITDELSSPSSRQALQHGVSGLQRLLFSQDKSSRLGDRQAVTYALLPVLVKSALVLGEPYRKELSTATWMGCRTALAGSSKDRTCAVAVMVTAADVLFPSQCGAGQEDISTDPAFWQALQMLATDSDAVARKRGRFLLQRATEGDAEPDGWSALLQLLSLLEDFAQHLIKDAWQPLLKRVHFVALQALLHTDDHSAAGTVHPQLDCSWLVCLWSRGFDHPNPQVQRHVLHSLLQLDWPSQSIAALPEQFVWEDILETFCKGGLASSTAEIALLNKFVKRYSSSLCASQAATFVSNFLRALSSSRLMKTAQAVMLEAAQEVAAEVATTIQEAGQAWSEGVVAHLRSIVRTAATLGSRERQHQVYQRVLSIAQLLLPAGGVDLELQASLLADIPIALLYPAGPISDSAKGWCMPDGVTANKAVEALGGMFNEYVSIDRVASQETIAVDAARCVHALVVLGPRVDAASLGSMLGLVQERIVWLGSRPYLPPGLPLRTLTLLNALLQAAQVGYQKQHAHQSGHPLLHSLPGFIHSIVPYLGDYALTCSSVFQSSPQLLNELRTSPQAVGAISEAAPSRLSLKLQAEVRLAHMAFQAISACFSITTVGLASSAWSSAASWKHYPSTDLERLKATIVTFITSVARDAANLSANVSVSQTEVQSAAAELRGEQLLVLAGCCHTLCGQLQSTAQDAVLGWELAQLIEALLEGPPKSSLASDAVSRLQSASWQALHPALSLLCHSNSTSLAPGLMGQIIAKAAAEAETVPGSALVPLISSLRVALRHAAAGPAVAAVAVQTWTPSSSSIAQRSSETAPPDGSSNWPGQAGHEHAEHLAEIVAVTSSACWQAIEEEDRLRPDQYEAFLQAYLAPHLLFNAQQPLALRSNMHQEQGPLKKLVQKLLHEGRRNARLATAVALHLSCLFLECPAVALLYSDDLLKLMLSDSKDPQVTAEVSDGATDWEMCPQLHEQLLGLDPSLAESLRSLQLSPRITIVCLMHHMAAVAHEESTHLPGQAINSWHDSATTLGQSLWQELLSRVRTDPTLSATNYQINSAVHRAKLRAWQALAVLSAFIPAQPASTGAAIDQLWPYLQSKEVSSVRQYMESILVNLAVRDPLPFMHTCLLPALQAYHHKQHEGITSAMLIACQLVKHVPESCREDMLQPLVAAMWPWTMWHHHAIRTLAHLVLHHLLEEFPEALQGSQEGRLAGSSTAGLASPWQTCLHFFRTNPDMQRLTRSMGSGLSRYSPAQAIAPLAVFHKGSQLAGEGGAGVEMAPLTLLEGVTNFLVQSRAGLHHEAKTVLAERISSLVPGASQQGKEQLALGSDFQRKMTPMDQLLLSAPDHAAAEQLVDLVRPQQQEAKRQELIVVASLIDKMPNLAGLTRTCEVFRAAALVVSDSSIAKDPMFASIAVTADQWVPMLEVPVHSLRQWMVQKKAEGFVLTGLEQTAESVSLPQFDFAAKSILLLGREREGIPADLLEIMDHTVEIPQLGLIRSLNVHVSGAIAMYEYTKQQLVRTL